MSFFPIKVWTRTIKRNGEIKHFGEYLYVGKKKEFIERNVDITFDHQSLRWVIRKKDGTLLKEISKESSNRKTYKRICSDVKEQKYNLMTILIHSRLRPKTPSQEGIFLHWM